MVICLPVLSEYDVAPKTWMKYLDGLPLSDDEGTPVSFSFTYEAMRLIIKENVMICNIALCLGSFYMDKGVARN